MAARLNTRQQEQTRAAIRTTQLVKRLQQFALGENDEAGQPVILDSDRIRSIDVLLRKALPDLQAVQHSGDSENPLIIRATLGGDGSRT